MINVNINPDLGLSLDPELFVTAGQTVWQELGPDQETDVTLVITEDAQIRELNFQFRGIDSATDVLSFPSDQVDIDSGVSYLGDIIISYPQAHRQAVEVGHPVETELQLLTVHGMLHLLGFDHATQAEKTEMWALQAMLLSKLGLVDIKILEDQD